MDRKGPAQVDRTELIEGADLLRKRRDKTICRHFITERETKREGGE